MHQACTHPQFRCKLHAHTSVGHVGYFILFGLKLEFLKIFQLVFSPSVTRFTGFGTCNNKHFSVDVSFWFRLVGAKLYKIRYWCVLLKTSRFALATARIYCNLAA